MSTKLWIIKAIRNYTLTMSFDSNAKCMKYITFLSNESIFPPHSIAQISFLAPANRRKHHYLVQQEVKWQRL